MAKIAYLGGGSMGQAMADRYLGAGHTVTIYNRTPEKLAGIAARGARVAKTPREAVSGAEIVFSSVTDDAASRSVWFDQDGALAGELAAGTLLVEHSTLSHEWVLELSGVVASHGLRYVDGPVAGRPDAAAAGQLILFVGASAADLDEVKPLIAPISKELFHFGPVGSGTAFKLIYNLMGVVQIVALAEGLAAAEAAGIDPANAARAFARGNTGSGHVIKHAPFMSTGVYDDPSGFTARGRLKDCTYGVQLEEKLGQRPRVGRAALAAYQEMVDLGMAAEADSRLIDVVKKRPAMA